MKICSVRFLPLKKNAQPKGWAFLPSKLIYRLVSSLATTPSLM
jgi:hypothetical protein